MVLKVRQIHVSLIFVFAASITVLLVGDGFIGDSNQWILNPLERLENIFYIWDSRVLTGVYDPRAITYIFLFLFYGSFSILGIPIIITQRLWLVLVLSFVGLSMYELYSYISNTKKTIPAIIAGLFYMFNPYTLMFLHGQASIFLLAYGALPLTLYLYLKGMDKKQYRYALLTGLVFVITSGCGDPPLVFINATALVTLWLYYFLTKKDIKYQIKFNALLTACAVISNLWWILPAAYYLFGEWTTALSTLYDNIVWTNSYSSFLEILRLLGVPKLYEYSGKYVSFSDYYTSDSVTAITTLAIPILSFSSLLFKKRNKYTLYFSILLILGIILAVGVYPPWDPYLTGEVFFWFYNNFPFFRIFRNTYKFATLICLSSGIMLAFTSENIIIKEHNLRIFKNKKFLKPLFIFLTVGLIFVNALPMISGNIYEQNRKVAIPDYYYQAADWLGSDSEAYRIYKLPWQNFPIFNWGDPRFDPPIFLFDKPLIYHSIVPFGSQYLSDLIDLSYFVFHQNQTEDFGRLIGLMGVKYVLHAKDADWEIYDKDPP
ncbi:MAG: alpha-(1-_3)-arabinofuranosyltransferase family protein, partial [Promethearchaeota archaeon]